MSSLRPHRWHSSRFGIIGPLLSVLIALVAAAWLSGHAAAAGPNQTEIQISAPSAVAIGQDIVVSARLTSGGVPVTSRRVSLFLDGNLVRTEGVDAKGFASFPISGKSLTWAHTAAVSVRFAGGPALQASASTAYVNLRPVTLTISTVPSVDNVRISVGSLTAVTAGGKAVFAIPKLGGYHIVPVVGSSNTAMKADFVRWGDNVYTPARDVLIEGDQSLDLGLTVTYRGYFHFVNGAGETVPSSRIQSVTLTGSGGTQKTLSPPFDNVWLEAGTAVRRGEGGLGESTRDWRVLEVRMSGTNVVNHGQQGIAPGPNAIWTVSILLFDLQVSAQDALFGGPLSGKLQLSYPDGTAAVVQLDGSRPASFAQLPRGEYVLRFSTSGLGAPTPVSLSRSQESVIRVISYLDLAVVGSVLLLGAVGLLWLGRRHQVVIVARRSRKWIAEPDRSMARIHRAAIKRSAAPRGVVRRAHRSGAAGWPAFKQEMQLFLLGLRLAPEQIGSWARHRAIRVGRMSQAFLRSVLRAAVDGLRLIGVLEPVTSSQAEAEPRERLQQRVPTPVERPKSVAERLREQHVVPAEGETAFTIGQASDVDPEAPSEVPSPGIAQTISRTFERSAPASMSRLVGSRYRGEVLPQSQRGICPSCRRSVPMHAAYCAGCGSRLPTSSHVG